MNVKKCSHIFAEHGNIKNNVIRIYIDNCDRRDFSFIISFILKEEEREEGRWR